MILRRALEKRAAKVQSLGQKYSRTPTTAPIYYAEGSFAVFTHHAKIPRAVAVGDWNERLLICKEVIRVSGRRRQGGEIPYCCRCPALPPCIGILDAVLGLGLLGRIRNIVFAAPMEMVMVHTHEISQTFVGRYHRLAQRRPA